MHPVETILPKQSTPNNSMLQTPKRRDNTSERHDGQQHIPPQQSPTLPREQRTKDDSAQNSKRPQRTTQKQRNQSQRRQSGENRCEPQNKRHRPQSQSPLQTKPNDKLPNEDKMSMSQPTCASTKKPDAKSKPRANAAKTPKSRARNTTISDKARQTVSEKYPIPPGMPTFLPPTAMPTCNADPPKTANIPVVPISNNPQNENHYLDDDDDLDIAMNY